MIETYKGRRLLAKKGGEGRTASFVNGRLFGYTYGVGPDVEAREIASLRRWVDAADERRLAEPDAYPAYWYEGAVADHYCVGNCGAEGDACA